MRKELIKEIKRIKREVEKLEEHINSIYGYCDDLIEIMDSMDSKVIHKDGYVGY